MRKLFTSVGAVMVASTLLPAIGQAGTLIPIPLYPGSTSTSAIGLNDSNAIAGAYSLADGTTHGFFGTLGGEYTTADGGNYDSTYGFAEATGINHDGWITGVYGNSQTCTSYAYLCEFVRKPDGTFVTVEKSGQPLGEFAWGITRRAKFVGEYESGGPFGVYLGKAGNYLKNLNVGCGSPRPRGINRYGTVVGRCDIGGGRAGFILQNGVTTLVGYPNRAVADTYLYGINDNGLATGFWANTDASEQHGFAYDTVTGTFYPFRLKGAAYTLLYGVNNGGFIAVVSDLGSFIYCPSKKANCPGGTLSASFGSGIQASSLPLPVRHSGLAPQPQREPRFDPDRPRVN